MKMSAGWCLPVHWPRSIQIWVLLPQKATTSRNTNVHFLYRSPRSGCAGHAFGLHGIRDSDSPGTLVLSCLNGHRHPVPVPATKIGSHYEVLLKGGCRRVEGNSSSSAQLTQSARRCRTSRSLSSATLMDKSLTSIQQDGSHNRLINSGL